MDSSKQCGAVMKHVKTISKPRPEAHHPDVFRMTKSICPMYVYAAENRQSIWYTGANHTRISAEGSVPSAKGSDPFAEGSDPFEYQETKKFRKILKIY